MISKKAHLDVSCKRHSFRKGREQLVYKCRKGFCDGDDQNRLQRLSNFNNKDKLFMVELKL